MPVSWCANACIGDDLAFVSVYTGKGTPEKCACIMGVPVSGVPVSGIYCISISASGPDNTECVSSNHGIAVSVSILRNLDRDGNSQPSACLPLPSRTLTRIWSCTLRDLNSYCCSSIFPRLLDQLSSNLVLRKDCGLTTRWGFMSVQ